MGDVAGTRDSRGGSADRGGASADGGPASAARASGVAHILLGAGFGVGSIWALLHLQANGELPMTPWGFRALSGPFEQVGQAGFTVLGSILAVVCAVDIVAGIRLWQRRRDGLRLSLLTTVPAFVLALGFALPFLLAGIPLRLVLALAGRRALR